MKVGKNKTVDFFHSVIPPNFVLFFFIRIALLSLLEVKCDCNMHGSSHARMLQFTATQQSVIFAVLIESFAS